MEVEHSSRNHAYLSCSGASRWLNCTLSPSLESEFEDTESEYAKEGTLAHEIADITLKKETGLISVKQFNKELKKLQKEDLYKTEMLRYVDEYVTYVLDRHSKLIEDNGSCTLSIEEKVDLSEYIPEGSGTCDANLVSDSVLEVIDLKYGKGVRVEAEDNPQAKLYALGAYLANNLLYDIAKIKLTIVQPRLDCVSTFELTVEELLAWAEKEVKPKAELAFKGEGKQKAGSWCRWCKAKPKCRALADYNLELARMDFEKPKLLTDEELAEVYAKIDTLTKWAESVKKFMLSEAISGKKYEGLKLVRGRSTRTWADSDKVIDTLLGKGYSLGQIQNEKVKGIGDISDLMTKDEFEETLGHLIHKPEGSPTLVPESDKREAIGLNSAKDDFSEPLVD